MLQNRKQNVRKKTQKYGKEPARVRKDSQK